MKACRKSLDILRYRILSSDDPSSGLLSMLDAAVQDGGKEQSWSLLRPDPIVIYFSVSDIAEKSEARPTTAPPLPSKS